MNRGGMMLVGMRHPESERRDRSALGQHGVGVEGVVEFEVDAEPIGPTRESAW